MGMILWVLPHLIVPSQVWYGIVSLADVGLASATSVSVKIDMEFRVRFFQQIDISGS